MNETDQLFCVLDPVFFSNMSETATASQSLQPAASKQSTVQLHHEKFVLSGLIIDRVISYALQQQKSLAALSVQDFLADTQLQYFASDYQKIVQQIEQQLQYKFTAGLQPVTDKIIVHTSPHHDDIILGYHAYAMRNLANNNNHIVYVTNGAHGVADEYVVNIVEEIRIAGLQTFFEFVSKNSYQQCIAQFAQHFHAQDSMLMQQARQLIVSKIITEVFGSYDLYQFQRTVDWLQDYFVGKNPDQHDHELIHELKGRLRQSESDSKWFIAQGHFANVTHLNAQFYDEQSDQAIEQDVQALLVYLQTVRPNIITVAMDPCGVGPATHFTTLQIVLQALQRHGDPSIEIWGYRNVWGAFTLAQTSMIVPIHQQEIHQMESVFTHCFATQLQPLFPSPLHDGSFSQLARQLQEHQLQDLTMLLGDGVNNTQAAGAIYLQKLTVASLATIGTK